MKSPQCVVSLQPAASGQGLYKLSANSIFEKKGYMLLIPLITMHKY